MKRQEGGGKERVRDGGLEKSEKKTRRDGRIEEWKNGKTGMREEWRGGGMGGWNDGSREAWKERQGSRH